jgi:hypothetical protein
MQQAETSYQSARNDAVLQTEVAQDPTRCNC